MSEYAPTILHTPKAEIDISIDLINNLLKEQFPKFADLPVTKVGEGWDNVMYRLGTKLAIRIPRRFVAAQLIENEQKFLNPISKKIKINTSAPVKLGIPSDIFPWHWSIIPWYEGDTADINQIHHSEARRYINFLIDLHQINLYGAPKNHTRGVSLKYKYGQIIERLDRLKTNTSFIHDFHYQIVNRTIELDTAIDPKWIHADLHPKNIIVLDGKIEAIIDWGDITSGDVATDLASIWMLFDDQETRKYCLELYPLDQNLILRSMAWAVFFGSTLLDIGLADTPEFVSVGAKIFNRVKQDYPILI